VELVAGQSLRAPISVEGGICYTALFEPIPGVDVRLRVLDETNTERAHASSSEGELAVQFCADEEDDWQLEISVAGGRGTMRWALYAGESGEVGGSTGLWLGERVATRPPRAGSCPGGATSLGSLSFRSGEARSVRARVTNGCQRLVLTGALVDQPWTARALDLSGGTWLPTTAQDFEGSWAFKACAPAGREVRWNVVAGESKSVEARIERCEG
jgi:hypothetical protein